MIKKANELCPVKLDPQNTTNWFLRLVKRISQRRKARKLPM